MADGFEIQVPITIKGGNEGEKVGKQIGEKIASQLNKSFKIAGISGGSKGGIEGKGDSKNLKDVSKRLGVIAAIGGASVLLLRKASPYLKGVLDIFGRAFMTFFRPFGDFLATLLKPLAILLMKFAVGFLKWAKTPVGKAVTAATVIVVGGLIAAAAIGTLAEQALAIAAIGTAAGTATPLVATFMSKLKYLGGLGLITIGIALAYDVLTTKEFGGLQLLKTLGIGLALGMGAVMMGFSAAAGITIGIIAVTAIIGWKFANAKSDYSKEYAALIPKGMKEKAYTPAEMGMTRQFELDPNANVGGIFNASKAMEDYMKSIGSYQTGTPFVPETGMYQLHRGEQVIPRNQTNNKSIIFKPTFQINGNINQDIDLDAMIRRASRVTEMELKSRGVI